MMKKCWILTSLFILFSTFAYGGDIRGRVIDAQGAAVAKTKVVVIDSGDSSRRWETTTASDGTYSITDVGVGSYVVTVTIASARATLQLKVSVPETSSEVRADFQAAAAPDSAAAVAEEQNPNIFVYQIDTNSLRNKLQIARGADTTYVPTFPAEQNYYAAEYGTPVHPFELIRPRPLLNSWRGSATGYVQNSVLNARNFFNVGPLLPSRASSYGLAVGGPLGSRKLSSLFQFSQGFTSGMVNGNIQAPTASEREPLATDPRVRAVIAGLLSSFPAELPNLPSVGPRQLNSNAPRSVKTTDALARFDYAPRVGTTLALRYLVSNYDEDPFQLVAGQNPQTYLRSQGAHISVTQIVSPTTVARFGFHFDRATALLEPTKRFLQLLASAGITAVPDIDTSEEFSPIGPGEQFPRRRFQNRFQPYAEVSHSIGRHSIKAGWSTSRIQLNDLQSDNLRGNLRFTSENGRSPIENFLLGLPSTYTQAVGELYRGFRNWEHFAFIQDQIALSKALTLNVGVRYELMTAPSEVNGLTDVGFHTDKNNFAPRIALAWNPGSGSTVVRASYGISYGIIYPATYQSTRFNPPQIQVTRVDFPDILNPLGGTVQARPPGRFLLSPDLVSPYSHQYSFGIERSLPWNSSLRLAYLGSRSIHLISQQGYNRAQPVAGIPSTTSTVQIRRADPRYTTIKIVQSNGIAYYDAMQVRFDKRTSQGLTVRAQYTFSKNIDTGVDFTNTAIDVQSERGKPTTETGDWFGDLKGWSLFDTPHAMVLNYTYELPIHPAGGWKAALLKGWQISGVTTFQSGTPYHIHSGSDSPGYGNVDGETEDRPNVLNPSLLGKSFDDPDTAPALLGAGTCRPPDAQVPYFRCAYFDANIPVGGRGNIGFNVFRKDGTNNWNVALGKSFNLPGQHERTLLFRTEFLNLANHAQFQKPGHLLSSATWGIITNTVNKGRQVQFALRLSF